MSEFFLPEVASLAGKDARTMRRWCIAGVVPGAFQTDGGHWRIKSTSLANAAAFAMRGAGGFSRKRTPRKMTISGKPIPPEMLARVEAMKFKQRKALPNQLAVLRILKTMPPEFAPDGVFESPFLADAAVSAIAWVLGHRLMMLRQPSEWIAGSFIASSASICQRRGWQRFGFSA